MVYLETLNLKNQELLHSFPNTDNNLKREKLFLEEEKGERESLLALQALQKPGISYSKARER
jgi:hypothetical protein